MDCEEILGGLFSKKGEKRSKKLVGIKKSIKQGFFPFYLLTTILPLHIEE